MQLQQGNDTDIAAELLFVCIADALRKRAIQCGLSREDADDAVQQTLFRIFEKGIKTYKGEKAGAWRWIWTIHRHIIIDQIKTNLRQSEKERSIDNFFDTIFAPEKMEPEQKIVNKDTREELRQALAYMFEHISEKDRELILRKTGKRREQQGKTWEEATARARCVLELYFKSTTD